MLNFTSVVALSLRLSLLCDDGEPPDDLRSAWQQHAAGYRSFAPTMMLSGGGPRGLCWGIDDVHDAPQPLHLDGVSVAKKRHNTASDNGGQTSISAPLPAIFFGE